LGLGLVDNCARHGVLETWVLVSRPYLKVMVLVLMPKVSVLVLKLGLVFWQLNKFGIIMLILKYKAT